MKTLLNDRFAPITSSVGFFEAPLETVGSALHRWRESLGADVAHRRLQEPFPDVLRRLEPLTLVVRPRELLLSTASRYTAYFDCFAQGPDPFGPLGYLCRVIGCAGLIVTCVPNTHKRGAGGRYGAVQFELLGPVQTDWLNSVRSVTAANDGGRWIFQAHGAVQPFEQPERYGARRIADRFTADMLDQYCAALGVQYFDPGFYGPEGVLMESNKPLPAGTIIPTMTLDEAQGRLGIIPG